MRLNQIKAEQVLAAVDAFEKSIDDEAVCAAASSFHGGDVCRIFNREKGGFNLCYFVAFDAPNPTQSSTPSPRSSTFQPTSSTSQPPSLISSPPSSDKIDRWVVRIPIIPRLGCPDEKHRSEIATMKYLLERSHIPIPKLYGYSLSNDNPIGTPFLIIEYIDASPLSIQDFKDEQWKQHIMRQLARLFIQFYQLTFDQIGSLTLGDVGEGGPGSEPWVFGSQRPLQSSISEQALADQNPSAIIPPHRTYTSAVDYYYALVSLAFNDWFQSRDAVRSEEDAREDLYDLYNFRSCVIDWIIPKYNYGPYYLMHGDLLPSNILVDSSKNFVAIIDWEWCKTVPAQLFVPPAWVTGFDITQACSGYGIIGLFAGTMKMQLEMVEELRTAHKLPYRHPLSELWHQGVKMEPFMVAHALLRPDKCITIYANGLDSDRYGNDTRDNRVSTFYSASNGRDKCKLISKKVADWENFKQEVQELGMELKEREDLAHITPTPELRKMFESDEKPTGRLTKFFSELRNWPWHLMTGATVATLCATLMAGTLLKGGRLLGRHVAAGT